MDEKTIKELIKQLDTILQKINKLKSKTINVTVNLKDKISKPLNKITQEINKLKGQKISLDVEVKEKTSKASNIKEKITKIAGAYKILGAKVVSFAKESVGAAQAQVANELKLRSVLSLRTNATNGQINSILKLTSAQQENGVVSDEVQMAGAGQLATYASNTASIKTLIPAMNNLLVKQKGLNGTTNDAAAVADLMGKGLKGQTEELEKAGIGFSDAQKHVLEFGSEEEKATVLAQAINDKVGDANKEMANTDVGAIQEAKNLFGDLKEQVGKMLLPCLGKLAKWFANIYKTMMKYKKITIIIGTFIGIFAGLITVISTIAGIVETLTAVQALFNLTLLGCPLVWIVVGIALVIAAIVGLILYWDELKAAAASVWESITEYFGNLRESVVGFFVDMVTKVKENWQSIIEFLKNPAKGVISYVADKLSGGEEETGETGKTNSVLPNGNALGTSYWKGGLTHINERGGEIVDLPNGSRVIPADKSDKLLNGSGVTFGNIYITAKGVTASEVVNEIVPRLKLSLANM